MKKASVMKTIKNWLAFGITILLMVVLFGVIFVSLDLAQPTPSFFLELGIIVVLSFTMRIFWYDFTEDKRLNETDLQDERKHYFELLDQTVKDTNDLDIYLAILNKENREHYVKNKIGSRTPKNLAKKTKWMCFWHPSYRNKTADEIGAIKYQKLLYKYQRKADKLKDLKSEEIMALTESDVLYDTKNYTKAKKRTYQIMSTIVSTACTILIACIAFRELMLNWTNVFRYVTYLFAIVSTIATTVLKAYRTTGEETLDWFSRLKFILDKYACYKLTHKEETNGD